jgi:hypothetical protein
VNRLVSGRCGGSSAQSADVGPCSTARRTAERPAPGPARPLPARCRGPGYWSSPSGPSPCGCPVGQGSPRTPPARVQPPDGRRRRPGVDAGCPLRHEGALRGGSPRARNPPPSQSRPRPPSGNSRDGRCRCIRWSRSRAALGLAAAHGGTAGSAGPPVDAPSSAINRGSSRRPRTRRRTHGMSTGTRAAPSGSRARSSGLASASVEAHPHGQGGRGPCRST